MCSALSARGRNDATEMRRSSSGIGQAGDRAEQSPGSRKVGELMLSVLVQRHDPKIVRGGQLDNVLHCHLRVGDACRE